MQAFDQKASIFPIPAGDASPGNAHARPVASCLIGISGFADVHYESLVRQAERGAAKLLGATVINQEQELDKCARLRSLGCELFTDYRDMLRRFEDGMDLCFIPTGIHLHAPMTLAALRAGANVFVEKPAAGTIQEVRAMQACSRETGGFVAVGYQTIYARETLWMKRAILDGEIGAIRAIKCRGLWPRLDSYYTRNAWAGRLRLDGGWLLDSPANNAISHQLNMACFLAGTGLTDSARLRSIEAELYRAHDIESADTVCMRILTTDGVPIFFLATHSSEQTLDPEIVVRGDRGTIHWTFERAVIETARGSWRLMECERHAELRDTIFARLRRRLTDPSTFICDLEIAAAQTLCVNGAHDSSPVHSIDPGFTRRFPCDGSVKTVVGGLDLAIEEGFNRELLFSELGVPWARPGRSVPLEDYAHFPNDE